MIHLDHVGNSLASHIQQTLDNKKFIKKEKR